MTSKASSGGTGRVTSECVSTIGLVEHAGEITGLTKPQPAVEPKRRFIGAVDVEAAHRDVAQHRAAHRGQRRSGDAAPPPSGMRVHTLDLRRLRCPRAELRL